jgi:hypothetical protein
VAGLFKGLGGVHQLARVFFEMDAFDAHRIGLAVKTRDLKIAVFTKGFFILGDLVTLGQVRIEIVLPGKTGAGGDGAVQGQARADAVFKRLLIQNRERPRLARAHGADLAIGRGFVIDGTAAEEFCPRAEFRMYFKTYDRIEFHQTSLPEILW